MRFNILTGSHHRLVLEWNYDILCMSFIDVNKSSVFRESKVISWIIRRLRHFDWNLNQILELTNLRVLENYCAAMCFQYERHENHLDVHFLVLA